MVGLAVIVVSPCVQEKVVLLRDVVLTVCVFMANAFAAMGIRVKGVKEL